MSDIKFEQNEIPTTRIKFSAYEEGKEVGQANLYLFHNELRDKKYGYLAEVFVNPECRGKGIGSKLVADLIEHAKDIGCYKLICTSRYSRPKVHGLYEKLGFVDYGKEFRLDF